jgi:ComF family protein
MQMLGISSIIEGFRTLVFPEQCLVCQSKSVPICLDCAQIWKSPAQKITFENLMVYSSIPYGAQVSTVVLKAKEERIKTAQKLIAQALARSLMAWHNEVNLKDYLLVPIPSSKPASRRRGGAFLHPILKQTIALCAKQGVANLNWRELLLHKKRVKDQSKLSYLDRRENLQDAFTLPKSSQDLQRWMDVKVILVDDVVTTGATLLSAAKALGERKMTVLGAATACATAHQLLIR